MKKDWGVRLNKWILKLLENDNKNAFKLSLEGSTIKGRFRCVPDFALLIRKHIYSIRFAVAKQRNTKLQNQFVGCFRS